MTGAVIRVQGAVYYILTTALLRITDDSVGVFNSQGMFKATKDALNPSSITEVQASIRDRDTNDAKVESEIVPINIDFRMVYIPSGPFYSGAFEGGSDLKTASLRSTYSYEIPRHWTYLDSYYIDTYEVSIEEYTAFLNDVERSDNGNYYYTNIQTAART